MTDHPTDDFDERLRSAARDYNRPAETPRERMWTEIRAARAKRATSTVTLRERHDTRRRLWLLPFAAAAVLLIGIAIGRAYDHWTAKPKAAPIAKLPSDSATPAKSLAIAPPDTV